MYKHRHVVREPASNLLEPLYSGSEWFNCIEPPRTFVLWFGVVQLRPRTILNHYVVEKIKDAPSACMLYVHQ